MDLLLRAITADGALRVLAAVTTDLVAEACRRHALRGVEAIALGRALTAGCLLTTLTKSPAERLRVDLRGDGPLGGLLVDAHGDGSVRGCLRRALRDDALRERLERGPGRPPVSPFVGRRGSLTVTRDLGVDTRYQGTVDLASGEVDLDFERYLNVSEQLPSVIRCEVLLDAQRGVLRAAGILCQTFPEGDREALDPIGAAVDDPGFAALLLHERGADELVRFVLGGAEFQDMGATPLTFRCGCGPATARGVLTTLGADDLDALAGEQPETEVRCSYCGERYLLSSDQLRALAGELAGLAPRPVRIAMSEEFPSEPRLDGPAGGRVRFRVIGLEDGMTLRQLLGRRLGLAVGPASALIRAGGVYIGKIRTCIPTLRVAEGERVTIFRGAAEVAPLDPDALAIVHRDAHCVVVNKPHGAPAAATREGHRGAVSHALVQRLARDGVLRPYVGLVFGLDPAAAGLVLFTVRGQDTASFFQRFADAGVRRVYHARLTGQVSGDMSCEASLARSAAGLRLARPDEPDAVPARTDFRLLAAGEGGALVEVELQRSPTDQIALHAAALGAPIAGRSGVGGRLELACVRLAFTHPLTGEALDLRAAPPRWADRVGA